MDATDATGHFKDGFNDCVVRGDESAVNAARTGTKAAAWYRQLVPAHGSVEIRLRLTSQSLPEPFAAFDTLLAQRAHEADEFYAELQREVPDADARLVQRQAFAGMIWSKQFYYYDVPQWLHGRPGAAAPPHSASTAAMPTGCTSTTPTSSRCRTSGSIPGTPPGTWRSTAFRSRWSMPSSPRSSSCC